MALPLSLRGFAWQQDGRLAGSQHKVYSLIEYIFESKLVF